MSNPIEPDTFCNLVQETLLSLKEKQKTIAFIWTPAHSEIGGNEIVDQKDKNASLDEPLSYIGINDTDLKKYYKNDSPVKMSLLNFE